MGAGGRSRRSLTCIPTYPRPPQQAGVRAVRVDSWAVRIRPVQVDVDAGLGRRSHGRAHTPAAPPKRERAERLGWRREELRQPAAHGEPQRADPRGPGPVSVPWQYASCSRIRASKPFWDVLGAADEPEVAGLDAMTRAAGVVVESPVSTVTVVAPAPTPPPPASPDIVGGKRLGSVLVPATTPPPPRRSRWPRSRRSSPADPP